MCYKSENKFLTFLYLNYYNIFFFLKIENKIPKGGNKLPYKNKLKLAYHECE